MSISFFSFLQRISDNYTIFAAKSRPVLNLMALDPDPAYSAHSFVVTPKAIPAFVSASNVSFVPVTSKGFYDGFLK